MRTLTVEDQEMLAVVRERCERLIDLIKVSQETGVMTEVHLQHLIQVSYQVRNYLDLAMDNKQSFLH